MTFLYLGFLILFAIIAWRNIHYAFLIILAVLPAYLLRFSVGGIPFTILEGMILILFVRWVILPPKADPPPVQGLRTPQGLERQAEKLLKKKISTFDKLFVIGAVLFMVAGIISVMVSPDQRAALGIFKAYIIEPILFFLVARDILSRRDLSQVITTLSIGALGVSFYGLAQRFLGAPIVAPWQSELRITSLFPYPNAVGLFLAPLIPLFIWQGLKYWEEGQLLNYKKTWPLMYWLLVIISSLSVIYFAKTWGAMVALVVVGLALGLWNKKTRKRALAVIIGAVVAIMLTSTTRGIITQKLTFKSWSGIVRLKMYEETWNMLKNSPIVGAGLSGYQTAIKPYHVNTWMEIFLYPHNIILAIWSELGLLGLLSAGVLLLWFSKQLLTRRDNVAIMLGASMAIILIHGLVDVPYFKNDLAVIFWLLLAMV